ncbi:hypothetical protein FACS1894182_01100 [Bacteroidia bacterium]|nr:hypothetical protein FACS1894182_01100 [Bacteroidia bacterium]
MMPEYPQQVQNAYRTLESQAETTRSGWHDTVSQRFFNDYMNRYNEDTNAYVQELHNTLTIIDKCQNEMTALM